MEKPDRIKQLTLHTTQGDAGLLVRESQFVVRYSDEALTRPEVAISLTMPPRPEGWKSNRLPPVLAMNLPEGFLRDRVLSRYRKVMDVDDDMNMLAITSSAAAGRVWASMSTQKSKSAASLSLREILSYKGTEKLFDDLLDRYSCPSISGVQPKVVVTEDVNATFDKTYLEKSAIKSPDLIIKSAGSQYPGLAENEFICMSIAKHVGLKTPEFFLSQDRNLFVIRRFDVSESGYLGFEDLAALTGRHPDQKYHGSYADIAKAISLNVATANRASSLDGFFRLLVVCCLLRNGDAHLKNFGVLYGDPSTASEDARLAPVYDVICSTIYIKNDVLALGLSGSKSWPTRAVLEKFGSHHCAISSPRQVIEETVEKAMGYRPSDELPMWPEIRAEMESGVAAINAAKGPTRGTSTASS